MEYVIKTLEGVSIPQLVTAFNQAFKGYFLPVNVDEQQLRGKMQAEHIDLSCSLGVFKAGELFGFILHGTEQEGLRWYNAGTGVVPEARGNQLVRQMYQELAQLKILKKPEAVILEVIEENVKAIRVYQAQGFEKRRGLNCFKGDLASLAKSPDSVEIRELTTWNPADWEASWELSPTWQNKSEAVLREPDACIYGAWQEDQCIGYIAINITQRKIRQLYVKPEWRRQGVASALMAQVREAHGTPWVILNVDENYLPLNQLFLQSGMEVLIRQWEMEWEQKSIIP